MDALESVIGWPVGSAAVGVVLLVSGNWMLNEAITYTHQLFDMIPHLLG